jgi:carboxylesterase
VTAFGPEAAEPFAVDHGARGVLVLHGYTGVPRSMRPLAAAFDAAGFSVELPLLPGHGTSVDDLVGRRYPDFFDAADASYQRLARRGGPIVVCGLSMGGTLALDLALAHAEIAGLVLVNPAVEPPAQSLYELLRAALKAGSVTMPSIASDIKRSGQSGGGYDATPIAAAVSIFEATERIAPRLAEISVPALLFSSRSDHVVPTSSSELVERTYGGPLERVMLEESYHVATLDNDAPLIERAAVAFAEKVSGG